VGGGRLKFTWDLFIRAASVLGTIFVMVFQFYRILQSQSHGGSVSSR
jgi:hypothetical protein